MLKGNLRKSEKFASYLRLSIEDGDKVESNSISNQRLLVKSYTENHPEIHIVEEYVDDGYTGTNFDRPGFKKMIGDIEEGKINGVIVKDLSRFGRDHIGVGKFLERVFPTIGIRFIAINDHYDSASENSESDSFIIPFKNLLNDSYCRDISIKVRSQLDVKRKNGAFVGNYAPFGYKKSEETKGRLEIDEYAAGIVKDIFNWKLDGCSAQRIAEKLNENGVPCPSSYKRICGIDYHSGFKSTGNPKWQAIQVFRILKNEVYIGSLIQGKRSRVNYKVKKIVERPEEEWIRAENVHKPIIPKKVFDLVQETLQLDTCASPGEKQVNLFSGIVRCCDCGQTMTRRVTTKNGRKYFYLNCGTYHKGNGCTSHLINEDKLRSAVISSINEKIGQVEDLEEKLSQISQEPRETILSKRFLEQQEMLQAEINKYTELRAQLYRDMADHVVTKEEYMCQIKSNLAPEGDAMAFYIDGKGVFHWIGPCCPTFTGLEQSDPGRRKQDLVKECLRTILSLGGVPTKDILLRVKMIGISEKTARNAGKEMNIRAYRKGGRWHWMLPDEGKPEGMEAD